jgi:hypothetical protein
MEIIEIQTLVDITRTEVTRPNQGSPMAFDQNRNFITLMQCIELRSVVSYEFPPEVENKDIKNMGFGSDFKGCQNVWRFEIIPDRVGVYTTENGNPVGSLLNDIDSVPIIKNLTETVNIHKAIFNCKDLASRNTIIKARTGTTT